MIKWSDGRIDIFIVKGVFKVLFVGMWLLGIFEIIFGGGIILLGGDIIVVSSGMYIFWLDGMFMGGSFGGGGDLLVIVGSSRVSGGIYSVSGYGIIFRGLVS